ncbi:MAG TPA: hypothetical protein VGD31_06830, partial [Sphingobacteriaceae bacterium]
GKYFLAKQTTNFNFSPGKKLVERVAITVEPPFEKQLDIMAFRYAICPPDCRIHTALLPSSLPNFVSGIKKRYESNCSHEHDP